MESTKFSLRGEVRYQVNGQVLETAATSTASKVSHNEIVTLSSCLAFEILEDVSFLGIILVLDGTDLIIII
jgi:hypothetical protein